MILCGWIIQKTKKALNFLFQCFFFVGNIGLQFDEVADWEVHTFILTLILNWNTNFFLALKLDFAKLLSEQNANVEGL